MKKLIIQFMSALFGIIMIGVFLSSCQKSKIESSPADIQYSEINATTNAPTPANPNFNLEVILRGEDNRFGHVKFRQANDIDKIVTLDVWLRDMDPNHEYKLQRAVDTNLDGNCTSTTWLTLGEGLVPQSIFTNDEGTANQELFRNLSSAPTGATFDIHFQVIDAVTGDVVLSSDCYQFTIR